jgi:hypothetical protein
MSKATKDLKRKKPDSDKLTVSKIKTASMEANNIITQIGIECDAFEFSVMKKDEIVNIAKSLENFVAPYENSLTFGKMFRDIQNIAHNAKDSSGIETIQTIKKLVTNVTTVEKKVDEDESKPDDHFQTDLSEMFSSTITNK